MAVAHDQATMELIKIRLSHSERPLVRLIKTFFKLSTTKVNHTDSSIEEIKIIHMTFLLELKYLIKTLKEFKGNKIIELNQSELNQLNIEKINLEEQAKDEKLKIQQLEFQLDQARKDRKNKMLYEEIGKEVRRFSDRFQSADRINGLAREIQVLMEEQWFYAERWASRRAQFGTVISNLEVLQESIKEEKADADRKKALNDDESDDGNTGDEITDLEIKPTILEECGNNEVEIDSQIIIKNLSTGILNPSAPSFLPNQMEARSSQITRHDEQIKINDTKENTIENHNNDNSKPLSNSSQLINKLDQPMEIDEIITQTSEEKCEDGLILNETAMEDGEEIEEAEEGEEMENET